MPSLSQVVGATSLGTYRLALRVRAKLFSLGVAGAFASFGEQTVIEPPLRVAGENRIAIGSGIYIGAGSWLLTLDGYGSDVALRIGDGTQISGACVISAAQSVTLGEAVLLARNVYISDNLHAFSESDDPVLNQGVGKVSPVSIGGGAWLGQNVIVCPGVRIGRNAVVGANSVVLSDVPDYAVAVGVPARIVRQRDAPREAIAERS